MFFRILIAVLLMANVAAGKKTGAKRITKGDPLSKVHTLLGTPELEYPLDDKLVQQYEECTVISRNGVVILADYKNAAEESDEPVEEEPPPTIEEIQTRARSGDAESQYLLAFCFQFGETVEQSYSAAVVWYTKAAMQGHMPSQHNLSYMYMTGKGVEKDYKQAYVWALLAAENGNDTMKEALVHRLSQEQILAAEAEAELLRLQIHAQPTDEKQQGAETAPDKKAESPTS